MPRSQHHRHRLLLAAAVLVPTLVAGWPPGPPAGARPAGEEAWVVGFRQLPPGLGAGSGYQGARVERVDATLRFAVVRAAGAQGFERRARSDPNVRYAEPDPLLPLIATTPNDPRFGDQYGPQQVRAPEAWDTTLGDTDASVCVIDTGVRSTHQDLAGPRWRGGTDFVNNDGDPADDNGHGTHVSGIAAAGVGNGTGIAGLGNVALYAVKALNAQGNGTLSAIASAIRWCADNAGPRTVVNMSLSSGLDATAVRDAVAYAQGRGALMVAAAGNGACTNCIGWPARYAQVMAVTCTTATRSLCSFSSTGPEAELTAPGSSILSLWSTGDTAYNTISGTSMSSPHVAGVAALVWSQATGLTNDQLRQALVDHATDLGAAGRDTQFGYGLVDAAATMGAVAGPPPPPPVTVMAENLDDGVAGGFTLGGLWHVSAACATPPSPPNQLGYYRDDTCTYATGARTTGSALVSVDLSGLTAASLSFAHRRQVESYAAGAFDVMRVQVSADGGATWTTLQQWDSRSPAQTGWTTQTYSLSAYVGSTVQLRWFFDSVDATFNSFAGWALDDIAVTGTPDLPPANRPPVANAGPDLAAADADGSGAEPVGLDGRASTDPDGTVVSHEWREGGNLIATGPTPTVDLAVGAHTIVLTVTDDDGATADDTVQVDVAANRPPTAAFSATGAGLVVDVDGSASTDPDGTIAGYVWSWGDGSPDSSGPTASHAYDGPGTYTVTLTVTDNGGATGATSRPVTVGQAARLSEDLDDGVADGFTLGGLWHVSAACATPPSPPNQLGYYRDATCTYATGARTTGSAQVGVDLSGLTSASLSFDHRRQVEVYAAGAFDVMRVQVSTNGGATWTTLQQWDSRSPAQAGWASQSYDLAPYVGTTVQLRWFFDSMDANANGFAGWALDNLAVTGT